jgi:DedD protein
MMDRALKERIIGAAVLVVFVVLVVPVFLDGPPEPGTVMTERVLLPGQDDQKTQTVVLERDRTEPVPVANAAPNDNAEPPSQDEPEEETIRQPEPSRLPPKPVAEPVQETPKDEPVASTTGMWAVQLGSFSSKENADTLAAQLRKEGYMAVVSPVDTASGKMYRVRVGPQENRAGAEQMAARLQKAGHSGQVVPHP